MLGMTGMADKTATSQVLHVLAASLLQKP